MSLHPPLPLLPGSYAKIKTLRADARRVPHAHANNGVSSEYHHTNTRGKTNNWRVAAQTTGARREKITPSSPSRLLFIFSPLPGFGFSSRNVHSPPRREQENTAVVAERALVVIHFSISNASTSRRTPSVPCMYCMLQDRSGVLLFLENFIRREIICVIFLVFETHRER